MRVLIAPDKFKGTLTASEAADAIARGVTRAANNRGIAVEIDLCPVADGGEGTAAIVEAALRDAGAFFMEVAATDLLGQPVTARVVRWKQDDGRFATLIESAQVIGLARVPEGRRDPTAYTSAALGRLLASMRFDDDARVIVALGGSATVDGGVGLAQVVGWTFEDENGREVGAARELNRVVRVHPASVGAFRAPITVLCDVANPLLGEHGAARVYGPQKGATPEQVEELERGLAHLVELCRRAGIPCDPVAPGSGAAGGLGFGLATFLGARLAPGAEFLLEHIGFSERVARADLVITGEGRLDSQTARRKAPMEVARRAGDAGRPVLAVVGAVGDGAPVEEFDGVTVCGAEGGSSAERLEEAAARAFGGWAGAR